MFAEYFSGKGNLPLNIWQTFEEMTLFFFKIWKTFHYVSRKQKKYVLQYRIIITIHHGKKWKQSLNSTNFVPENHKTEI